MTASDSHQWVLPAVVDPQPLTEIDLPLPIRTLLMRRGLDLNGVKDL